LPAAQQDATRCDSQHYGAISEFSEHFAFSIQGCGVLVGFSALLSKADESAPETGLSAHLLPLPAAPCKKAKKLAFADPLQAIKRNLRYLSQKSGHQRHQPGVDSCRL
jgi:hypothetical protein